MLVCNPCFSSILVFSKDSLFMQMNFTPRNQMTFWAHTMVCKSKSRQIILKKSNPPDCAISRHFYTSNFNKNLRFLFDKEYYCLEFRIHLTQVHFSRSNIFLQSIANFSRHLEMVNSFTRWKTWNPNSFSISFLFSNNYKSKSIKVEEYSVEKIK